MNQRLLRYAKLLKDRLNNDGCMFIIQKVSKFQIIQEYHRNKVDSKIIEHTVNTIPYQYRLELGKDIVKVLLTDDKI